MASKIRSGSSSCLSSQSTPSWVETRPLSAASLSPSDDGSTPIIQRGSITSERSSLYMRSVPMLPGPTIAAVLLVIFYSSNSAVSVSKPLIDASTLSPGANGTNGPSAPDRTR